MTEEEKRYIKQQIEINGSLFKNKPEGSITLPELFDQAFMEAYKLNDDQYDYICDNATDEELDILCQPGSNIDGTEVPITFAMKRQMVVIVKKYKQLHGKDNANYDF